MSVVEGALVIWPFFHSDWIPETPADEIDRKDDGLDEDDTPNDIPHRNLVAHVFALGRTFVEQTVGWIVLLLRSLPQVLWISTTCQQEQDAQHNN